MEYREVYLTFIILANAVLVLLHGLAHFEVHILPGLLDTIFIVLVIGIAPLVALLFILGRTQFYGALLLFFTLPASLIYGLYHHFLAAGVDNALKMPANFFGMLFLLTSLILLITETVGTWIAGAIIYRSMQSPSSSASPDAQ